MADLNTDVRYIKGVGEAKAKALGKLGIAAVQHYLLAFLFQIRGHRFTGVACADHGKSHMYSFLSL